MKSSVEYYKDEKFALILVDIQNIFGTATEQLKKSLDSRMDTINRAIELFRENDYPIIYVKYVGFTHDGHPVTSEGEEFVSDLLPPRSVDYIVEKRVMNSFRESNLAEVVKSTGCKKVLIAGMVAHYCVLATYFGAFDHDLSPYMLENGIASTEERMSDATELVCKTIGIDELIANVFTKSS